MSFNENLKKQCNFKNNRLCIGLDFDNKWFENDSLDYMQGFIEDVIESTIDLCPVYKINFAFYEKHGFSGYKILEKIPSFVNGRAVTIADAKRGDIGNTSKMYAKSFFETFNFDAITLSPYMGKDSSLPYLNYDNKWIILLALTSNDSSLNIQHFKNNNDKKLYQHVIEDSLNWSSKENTMYVVGANRLEEIQEIRKIVPYNFLLIPGVGAQGNDLREISLNSINDNCGIIVNISRDIIYSDSSTSFELKVRDKTLEYQNEMESILDKKGII